MTPTTYAVKVTATDVGGGQHRTTCSCSCGWTLTTSAATSSLAGQIAAKAKSNHLQDVHLQQQREARPPVRRPGATTSPGPGAVPVVRAGLGSVHGHTPFIAMAVKDGFLWTRSLKCSCGWATGVSERTPFLADKALRSQHRAHVDEKTDRAPIRDYVVLIALVIVVMTICFVLASTVVDVSG